MGIKIITPPAAEPVSIEEARDHVREVPDQQEIQTLSLGGATGGTFTLGDGSTEVTLAHNASKADIEAALESIYGVGTLSVDDGFVIEFVFDVGASGLEADFSDLTGATTPALVMTQQYGSSQDDLIARQIASARRYCESVQNRAYVTQTLELVLDQWPASVSELPRPPLQTVAEITYTDSDGNSGTVDSGDYTVDADGYIGRVALKSGKSWPAVRLKEIGGVRIRFTAGYGDPGDVPEDVKQAMLLLVGHWYNNREAAQANMISQEIKYAVEALLGTQRVWPS